jgi:hypothetical protein
MLGKSTLWGGFMRSSWLGIAFACVLLAACSSEPQYTVQTLPDGKQVKVLGVAKVFSTSGGGWLILSYQTDLPMSDVSALAKEADHLWPYFKNDVEKAGMKEGAIKAVSEPVGTIVKKSTAFTFVYRQGPDGAWSRVEGS